MCWLSRYFVFQSWCWYFVSESVDGSWWWSIWTSRREGHGTSEVLGSDVPTLGIMSRQWKQAVCDDEQVGEGEGEQGGAWEPGAEQGWGRHRQSELVFASHALNQTPITGDQWPGDSEQISGHHPPTSPHSCLTRTLLLRRKKSNKAEDGFWIELYFVFKARLWWIWF